MLVAGRGLPVARHSQTMSQRLAILSDVHGNLEALRAVVAELDMAALDELVVLGDVVGYGPDPAPCLELLDKLGATLLLGNHEGDLLVPDPDMDVEQKLRDWTAAQIDGQPAWKQLVARWRAAGQVEPLAHQLRDDLELVHGSPDSPVTQYIWPAHPFQYIVFNDQIDERLRGFLDEFSRDLGFCGHTHVPAVLTGYDNRDLLDPYRFRFEWNRETTFIGPGAIFVVPRGELELVELRGRKVVINPGSVGQPRDGLPEAAYALFDGERLTMRRVAYDRTPTLQKLRRLPLEQATIDFLCERLVSAK